MCTQAGLLIGWDDGSKRALVAWANCDSWSCEDCAKRMSERWGMRANFGAKKILDAGEALDFFTITSHEKLPDFESTEKVWRKAWGALYNALKRQNKSLEYMIVPEKHEDGRMHVHGLWNAGVAKRWLKDNARKRGLGYMVDVSHISTSGGAAKYVTKYVGKNLGIDVPKHFRRVRVSHGWADIPAPDNALVGLRWEHIGSNGALETVYAECQEKGIALIDLKTGEKFDDVDLGTIVLYA